MREPRGPAWWDDSWEGVLIRIQYRNPDGTPKGEPRLLKARAEQLQSVMDKAAASFSDPSRPQTRAFPASSSSSSISRPKRYHRT